MWSFIAENAGTILVALLLLAAVAGIVGGSLKARKKGKPSGCGCGCADCALKGRCGKS